MFVVELVFAGGRQDDPAAVHITQSSACSRIRIIEMCMTVCVISFTQQIKRKLLSYQIMDTASCGHIDLG